MTHRAGLSWSRDRRDPWRVATLAAGLLTLTAAGLAILGLPGVDLHGPQHQWGLMSPTCGGTRAARLTAMGDLPGAWTYNPLGIVVVVGAALLLARAAVGGLTRTWWTPRLHLAGAPRWLAIVGLLALVAALWARQQSIAPLLMQH
ncbi:DUF2752 domain-containing protein [Nocardioides panacisoli]|uniref:DUF2752 domain-containing protein n=1 Tax=Nocardioides panacisoli TaxID=627624 RepID=UPI001C62EC87|nr:DUF2752 domain-containing protein [Nocardioides panacisoli]QYJ05423.1 DUF2752 domain-containing protein [Nocardioides panacisoli]